MLRVLQVKILINNIYLKYQESILCQLVTIKNHIISQHPDCEIRVLQRLRDSKNKHCVQVCFSSAECFDSSAFKSKLPPKKELSEPQNNNGGNIADKAKAPNRWKGDTLKPKRRQRGHRVSWADTAKVGHL